MIPTQALEVPSSYAETLILSPTWKTLFSRLIFVESPKIAGGLPTLIFTSAFARLKVDVLFGIKRIIYSPSGRVARLSSSTCLASRKSNSFPAPTLLTYSHFIDPAFLGL